MKIFTTMSLMAALAVAPAFAQPKPTIRANVPFDFVVGKAVLPAGQYDIKAGASLETILVRETAGSAGAFVITNPTGSAVSQDETSLVFRTTGDTHYLQAVNSPSGSRELRNAPAKGGTVSVIKAALVK
jgi:hypothetical protein